MSEENKSLWEVPVSIKRLNPVPLDISSVYNTLKELEGALNSSTSVLYEGQRVFVTSENTSYVLVKKDGQLIYKTITAGNEVPKVSPDGEAYLMPFDPADITAGDEDKLVTQGALIERLAYNSEGVRAKYELKKQSGWRRILNIIRDSCGSVYLSLALGAPTATNKDNRLLIENGGSIQTVGFDFNAFVKYFNDTTKEGSPEVIQKFNKIFGTDERAKYQSRISKIRIGYPKYGTSFDSKDNNKPTGVDNKYNPINCYVDIYMENHARPGGYDGQPNLSVVYYGPTNNHNSDVILSESLENLDTGIYNETLEFYELPLTFNPVKEDMVTTKIKNTGMIKMNNKTLSSIEIPKEDKYFGINTYKRFNMLPLGLNSGGFSEFLNQGIQNFINVKTKYDSNIQVTIKPSGVIESTSNRGTTFTTTTSTTPVFIPQGKYLTNLYEMTFQDGTYIKLTNLPEFNGNHQYYGFWENDKDRVLTKSTMSFMNCYPYKGADSASPYYIFPYLIPYKEEYGTKELNSSGKITIKYQNFEIIYDESNDVIKFIENNKIYEINDYRELYSQPYSTHYSDGNIVLNFKTLQNEKANLINNTGSSVNYIKDPFWRYKEIFNNNYDSVIVTTGSEKNDRIHTEAILSFETDGPKTNNPYIQTFDLSQNETAVINNALKNSEITIITKVDQETELPESQYIFSQTNFNNESTFLNGGVYKVTGFQEQDKQVYFDSVDYISSNTDIFYCRQVPDGIFKLNKNYYVEVVQKVEPGTMDAYDEFYFYPMIKVIDKTPNQPVEIDNNIYISDENGEIKGVVFNGQAISIKALTQKVEITYQKDINDIISTNDNNALQWGSDKGLYVSKGEMGQADTDFDPSSLNPIANKSVTQRFEELEAPQVELIDKNNIQVSGIESTVILSDSRDMRITHNKKLQNISGYIRIKELHLNKDWDLQANYSTILVKIPLADFNDKLLQYAEISTRCGTGLWTSSLNELKYENGFLSIQIYLAEIGAGNANSLKVVQDFELYLKVYYEDKGDIINE